MGMGKLRIGGAWSGVLEVELDEWIVATLREEVAKKSSLVGPQCINLISAGRVLRDGDGTEKLSQLGVKNNAKILASKVSTDQEGKSLKEEFLAEERSKRLSRLKAAATSLASRHADGSLPVEDFNLELENQSGEKVQLGSETDQRVVMMGLMLHANAKALIKRQRYKDALEVLTIGEEAFSLCNHKVIEMVDNVSILQIDMVWCYFMLHDISWLSVAGIRLTKAREGIEHAHGKESSRMRALQGGRCPELALYLRLQLLEGVIAYHNGQLQKSKEALTAVQAKYTQLQVTDETLSLLMSMGYKARDAKRALRMSNQDVGSAVDFLVEEKAKKEQKREEDHRRQQEILEQKKYGMTPLRKPVDLQKLNELVSIGFEKELAAEALRKNENDTQKALDDLTNPETNSVMQKRLLRAIPTANEELVSMGFPRAIVDAALRWFGTQEQALNHLLGKPNANAVVAGANPSVQSLNIYGLDAGQGLETSLEEDGGGPSNREEVEDRDAEMEDELTGELQKGDAYSDYDIDITLEGEAINEYLAKLAG
ncbi:NEDD8 ultimate buster 1 [Olea europaea subsp. europaea]|uniref:NEDD8 ultimate buster 1 n=1 Tax=Olea europaea subsp. europaea TaxID=158383 RepID=A0A8S0TXW8_OLEEU|nr:NEDD8 ultimate buster 1 [Olea europaea subsp. europaea]